MSLWIAIVGGVALACVITNTLFLWDALGDGGRIGLPLFGIVVSAIGLFASVAALVGLP